MWGVDCARCQVQHARGVKEAGLNTVQHDQFVPTELQSQEVAEFLKWAGGAEPVYSQLSQCSDVDQGATRLRTASSGAPRSKKW